MGNKPQMSLTNKMLQIWGTMAPNSSDFPDKDCRTNSNHFLQKNKFLEDTSRCPWRMHSLRGSTPPQGTASKHLHLRCPDTAQQGKDCTLEVVQSKTTQMDTPEGRRRQYLQRRLTMFEP